MMMISTTTTQSHDSNDDGLTPLLPCLSVENERKRNACHTEWVRFFHGSTEPTYEASLASNVDG